MAEPQLNDFREFDENRFLINDPPVLSEGVDKDGAKITNYIYKYSYVYPIKDENGNITEKTSPLVVQLGTMKVRVGPTGFKTEKKISKDKGKPYNATSCWGKIDVVGKDSQDMIRIGPPKIVPVGEGENDNEGAVVPPNTVDENDKPYSGETVPRGFKLIPKSFYQKLYDAVLREVFKHKSKNEALKSAKNLDSLSISIKDPLDRKVKGEGEIDESSDPSALMTLIDINEPGAYNRKETSFKLPILKDNPKSDEDWAVADWQLLWGKEIIGNPLVKFENGLYSAKGMRTIGQMQSFAVLDYVESQDGGNQNELLTQIKENLTESITEKLKRLFAEKKVEKKPELQTEESFITGDQSNENNQTNQTNQTGETNQSTNVQINVNINDQVNTPENPQENHQEQTGESQGDVFKGRMRPIRQPIPTAVAV